MPEYQHRAVFNDWYHCAQSGLAETSLLMKEIGPEVVNRDQIAVTFVCKEVSGA